MPSFSLSYKYVKYKSLKSNRKKKNIFKNKMSLMVTAAILNELFDETVNSN